MRRTRRRLATAATAAVLVTSVATGGPAATGDSAQPGSYCPFPAQGEKPVCFAEVEHQFGGFLEAVDAGEIDAAELSEVEDQLQRGPTEAERTLALSSLAYGYFMLAARAAAAEHPDPALVQRLQGWNELLGTVYADARSEPSFRTAIREAARDLDTRAPAVLVPCEEAGANQPCRSTSALLDTLRGIDDPEGESGVRGALGHLLDRILDDRRQDESPPSD